VRSQSTSQARHRRAGILTDFPLASAFRNANFGLGDAFVTKLSAAGTIVYSTYLGGMGADIATGIAVDDARHT
jgi:hypothetical protein